MKQSSFINLNWQDALHGLIMAVGGALVALIAPILDAWSTGAVAPQVNPTTIWHTAAAAAAAYIIKQLLTPATPVKEVTKTEDGTITKTVVKTDSVDITAKQ